MPFNPTNPEPTVPVVLDDVDAALQKAKLEAKRERQASIGRLLDQATEVLGGILETTDEAHQGARMRAAEVAVNLYVQSENGDRQDRMLEIQERRLAIEEAKLSQPGGPMFNQQNNFYLGNQKQQGEEVKEETPEEKAQALLARKKMQEMLLSSFLEPARDQAQESEEEHKEEHKEESSAAPAEAVLSSVDDLLSPAGSKADEE